MRQWQQLQAVPLVPQHGAAVSAAVSPIRDELSPPIMISLVSDSDADAESDAEKESDIVWSHMQEEEEVVKEEEEEKQQQEEQEEEVELDAERKSEEPEREDMPIDAAAGASSSHSDQVPSALPSESKGPIWCRSSDGTERLVTFPVNFPRVRMGDADPSLHSTPLSPLRSLPPPQPPNRASVSHLSHGIDPPFAIEVDRWGESSLVPFDSTPRPFNPLGSDECLPRGLRPEPPLARATRETFKNRNPRTYPRVNLEAPPLNPPLVRVASPRPSRPASIPPSLPTPPKPTSHRHRVSAPPPPPDPNAYPSELGKGPRRRVGEHFESYINSDAGRREANDREIWREKNSKRKCLTAKQKHVIWHAESLKSEEESKEFWDTVHWKIAMSESGKRVKMVVPTSVDKHKLQQEYPSGPATDQKLAHADAFNRFYAASQITRKNKPKLK